MKNNIINHPLYKKLLKEFHPTKNGELKLSDFSSSSRIKIWWKCYNTEFDDHEWEASINKRVSGGKCHCCCGQKVVLSNCLATLFPELIRQWHPTKNKQLTPFDFTSGSKKRVYWKCNVSEDHEWETTITHRTNDKTICPCCSGNKTVLSNCLSTTHPEIAKQWNSTKNGKITPFNITAGSNKKVYWKCDKADDHEWKTSISKRTHGQNCPCCCGQKVVLSNCLAITNPELAKKWHPIKNGNLTSLNVTCGSPKKVWWICDKADDHEWEAVIAQMATGNIGCSCCSGHKTVLSNCLYTTYPEISKEWDVTKNGNLTPIDVVAGTDKKVWWKCDKCNHNWNCKIASRTKKKSGCPICNESKGEKSVANFLNKLSIIYDREKKFDKCKNKRKLPFDFYLPNENILIEYDGILHYKPDEFMGGEKAFKKLQLRDAIKTKFAKDNNIPLLRIPYTQFNNIEVLINSFILKESKKNQL